jgi:alkylated DNA nucleotide flippase Atl1
VLFTAAVFVVPAALINLAVGKWGPRHQALSWWRAVRAAGKRGVLAHLRGRLDRRLDD